MTNRVPSSCRGFVEGRSDVPALCRIPAITAAILLFLVMYFARQGGGPVAAADIRPLEIYFVDVEGGAATLIVTPAGESLLVDSGWPREDGRDALRIQQAAQKAGLKRMDALVTTHFHRDHFGGVARLQRLLPIGRYYDHGKRTSLPEDRQYFPKLNEAYLQASSGLTRALAPGQVIPLKSAAGSAPLEALVVASNGATLRRAGPENPECQQARLQEEDTTDNARSVGLLVSFGKFRFLDLGDLTWNKEQELVCPSNALGRVDLYQVTHHGMNISNNPALLASVRPQVAVMNNGPRKGGHPDVVKWLRAVPGLEALYQVHRNLDTTDADNAPPEFLANLEPEEKCPGRMIQVWVAPDGTSYTVTNTRTGKSQKYTVRN